MKFYRYEYQEYGAGLDVNGFAIKPVFPNIKLNLITYDLIKETNKCYWIGYGGTSYKKLIRKNAKSSFAYNSKEKALQNFIKRNERRIKIIDWQKACCESALNLAKGVKESISVVSCKTP